MHDGDFLAVGCGLNDCSCIASDFVVLVLVLNEVVLVLDAVSSSTSTANAEYEYENLGKTSTEAPKGVKGSRIFQKLQRRSCLLGWRL